MKSFRPRDDSGKGDGLSRNREANVRGQKRKNDTHASTTAPAARLHRKGRGKSAQLCFMSHTLVENRSGLAMAATVTCASGTAEREAALKMLGRMTSCSISRSSVRSATIFLSRLFSSSSCFSRRISSGSRPAYFLFQLKYVAWLIPSLRQISATGTPSSPFLRVRKLRCFHRFRYFSQPGKLPRKTPVENDPVSEDQSITFAKRIHRKPY